MRILSRRSFLKLSGLAAFGLAFPSSKIIPAVQHSSPSAGVDQWLSGKPATWNLKTTASSVPAVVSTASITYELQTPHYVFQMDYSSSGWQDRFSQLVTQGYRMLTVQGVDNPTTGATISAIWVRDGLSQWIELQGMDSNSYQTNFISYFLQGYHPISVSGYQDSGAVRFAAIWVKDSALYDGRHNINSGDYQTFANGEIVKSYQPMCVDGYANGTADNYIAIWANEGPASWIARHGTTSSDYQTDFNSYSTQGYLVTDLSAYEVNGVTKYAYIMKNDGTNPSFYGRHDYDPAPFYSDAVTRIQNDNMPTVLEPYTISGARKFGGIWLVRSRT
jgi:hypothetical protein